MKDDAAMIAEQERAAVVAYLRRPRTGMGYIGRYLANKIEAGEHLAKTGQ